MNRSVFVFCFCGLLLFAPLSGASAKEGFYLGAGLTNNSIGGDFKGDSALKGGDEILIIPKIESAFGGGITAGFGFTDQTGIEFSYILSNHTGDWLGSTGDVEFSAFDINIKYNFFPYETMQPYLLAGVGADTLTVKDGAINIATGEIGDAKFNASSFNLGGGVDYYTSENISVSAGLIYRFVEYDEAKGLGNTGKISNPLDGANTGIMVSVFYHFN